MLIQAIFSDLHYRQPFFLTYYSTSLFALYLPIYYVRQWLAKCWSVCPWSERGKLRRRATRLRDENENENGGVELGRGRSERSTHPASPFTIADFNHDDGKIEEDEDEEEGMDDGSAVQGNAQQSPRVVKQGLGQERHNDDPSLTQSQHDRNGITPSNGSENGQSKIIHPSRVLVVEGSNSPTAHDDNKEGMSTLATAKLSFFLCPIWFFMNYFFNFSLNLTSLASSTILSTTSSLFVLLFTRCLQPSTRIRWQHAVGVLATILGAALITFQDEAKGARNAADANPTSSSPPTENPVPGDIMATVSALFYGFYTVILKTKIPDEDKIEMQLLFGFLGLFNAFLLWPLFLIFHASGVEPFQAPPSNVLLFLTLNGVFGTVLSDLLWAKGVLLTSPLIATLALTLTIPLALMVDWMLGGKEFAFVYLLGGAAVLVGFALVNMEHRQAMQMEENERIGVDQSRNMTSHSTTSDHARIDEDEEDRIGDGVMEVPDGDDEEVNLDAAWHDGR